MRCVVECVEIFKERDMFRWNARLDLRASWRRGLNAFTVASAYTMQIVKSTGTGKHCEKKLAGGAE